MASATKIMRKSISTLLKTLPFFASAPSLLILPFALASLVSPSIAATSSLFHPLLVRLSSLLLSAGIPPNSHIFPILTLKLTQSTLSFLFTSPFTISLLLSKASIIKNLHCNKNNNNKLPFTPLFHRLLFTQLYNFLFIISSNASSLGLIAIFFNLSSPRFLLLASATAVILYSIILANTYVVCNLSLVESGVNNCGGLNTIVRVCILMRSISATSLSLALPINVCLAAMEAVFERRVVRAYYDANALNFWIVSEAMIIAYLCCLLFVLDTIVGFVLLESCRLDQNHIDHGVLYLQTTHNV